MLNFSLNTTAIRINEFQATQDAVDWCSAQHIVHSNNIEVGAMWLIAFAYFGLLVYFEKDNFPRLAKYQDSFIYISRLALILFIGYYVFIIRLRLPLF